MLDPARPPPSLEQMASFGSLLRAFGKARRAKRGKGGEPAFYRDLEENLLQLSAALRDGSWRPDPYRYFVLWSGKQRVVAEASFRDRVVHHALVAALEPAWEVDFADQSYACRKGKGSHLAVRRAHQLAKQNRYALRLDIRRYFDHVDHAVLLGLLGAKVDAPVLDVCRAILAGGGGTGHPLLTVQKPDVGIPIGNLTSQFWANVYLDPVDRLLGSLVGAERVLRYMDDFLVFGDDKPALWQAYELAAAYLSRELRLEVKTAATRLAPVHAGIGWLGFQVFPATVRLDPGTRRRLGRKLTLAMADGRGDGANALDNVQRASSVCAHVTGANSRRFRQSLLSGAECRP